MYRLVNKVILEPDEHIWSYFTRNLMANAIVPGSSDFMEYMGYKEKGSYAGAQHYYIMKGWRTMPKALSLSFQDVLDLHDKAGVYPFEKHTLNDWTQIVNILYAFRNIDPACSYQRLFSNSHGYVREARLCPECMREELQENGFFYYHREHQISGNSFCRKHHRPLMRYRGNMRYAFSQHIRLEDVPREENNVLLEDYAGFAHEILEGKLSREEIAAKAGTMLDRCMEIHSEPAKTLKLLQKKAVKLRLDKNEVMERLHMRELTLLSPYREDAPVLLRHSCGHAFISSLKAVMAGFGCPICDGDVPDNDIISDMIRFLCGNQFTLEEFKGTEEVLLTDESAGEEYRVRWGWVTSCRERKAKGIPPVSPNLRTFEGSRKRQRLVKDHFGEDYELVEKVSRLAVKIRYIPTGETFIRNWNNILNGTASSPMLQQEKEEKLMAERQMLTKQHFGEEYEIAEWVDNNNVLFKNNKTGETFKKTWQQVVRGTATPPSQMTAVLDERNAERDRAIKACFGDDYALEKYNDKTSVLVKHIPTGEVFGRKYTDILAGTAKSPQKKAEERALQIGKLISDKYGDGYELAEIIDRMHVLIRDVETGETFPRTLAVLRMENVPPEEKEKKQMETRQRHDADVKQCFGNDYEFVKLSGDKYYVKYIPTGEVFTRRISKIKDGSAISPMQLFEQKKLIVTEAYDGEFELVEFLSGERAVLRDIETGETKTVSWRTITKKLERMGMKNTVTK